MTVFHVLRNESVCRAPLQLGCLVVGSPVTFVAIGKWALILVQHHHPWGWQSGRLRLEGTSAGAWAPTSLPLCTMDRALFTKSVS